jgi:hypothetical protein
MDRKKELKLQYKQMKPPMGIFIIRSKVNNKCFLKSTGDLRGVINGTKARLEGGFHPNAELQKEWKEFGSENFTIEILENLEYDRDESKTDYSEELELMQMIWEEKLAGENLVFYKKRV